MGCFWIAVYLIPGGPRVLDLLHGKGFVGTGKGNKSVERRIDEGTEFDVMDMNFPAPPVSTIKRRIAIGSELAQFWDESGFVTAMKRMKDNDYKTFCFGME